jgi:hypothetical protein
MAKKNQRSHHDLVQSLDLKSIAKSIGHQKLLSPKKIPLAEELYRVFLFLRKTYPSERLVPHPLADIFWHEHILQSRKYHADCKKVFGKYLHHDRDSDVSKKVQARAVQRTLELIEKHFLK